MGRRVGLGGVGRNCPQQAGSYADATESREDGEAGAHSTQDRDGQEMFARKGIYAKVMRGF